VAVPAAVGLRVLLKYWRAPDEVTVFGICAGWAELGGGEQRSQRRRSISWQDLVRREGAVVDSLRQFPLGLLVFERRGLVGDMPDVTMGEVPPAYWLCVVDGHNLPNNFVFQQ